jgi:N-acetylglutamate synthase-like GNAT family acetyltransferase
LTKPTEDKPRVEHMSYMSSYHFAEMEAKFCPLGERALYCVSIAVHPAHQARGIGTALVRWVCDKADADGVPVWVHTSEAAPPLFSKAGFEVVKTLTLDLDEWATKKRVVDGEEKKWGKYTFRYMVRQPRKTS